MSEQDQVVALIKNILQHQNNQLRAENEKLLSTMTETKLPDLAIVMINILKGNEAGEIKQFVITHLRKNLSAFNEKDYAKSWGQISPEHREYIRTSLFQSLHEEKSSGVRNMCADAIGQIAGTIINLNHENWPKFVDYVYLLLKDSNPQSITSGLLILENFFSYCPEMFSGQGSQLYPIFKKAFEHENNKVKCAGIKAFSGYVLSVDKKEVSKLESLVIPLYQVSYHLLTNDKGDTDGLQALSDLIEMQPRILKKSFHQLNELMQNVIKLKDVEPSIKRMATESLISFAERQNKERLAGLIELLFYHMIEIDEQISDEWKKPPEGYSENVEQGDDFQTTTFGMTSVDRLIASIGQKQMLPLLSVAVQKMLAQPDWRYKYASVMALSQTGEYIEDAASVKGVVDMLLVFLGDANPMLRFASCHAIGQISDDMKPHYQQKYGKESFFKLASLLKDPIPRVVSHAASALTNLIEGMEYADIAQYMPELIGALLELSTTGISLVKESALTTIASLAELAKEHYIPYFQKTSEVLFAILASHQGKEYKELKGLVVEALTSIAEGIGKQPFKPVATPLIEYLITLQESQLEQVDPQKQYVLGGWQRLCVVFGKDIGPYLPRILPGLFKLVEQIVETRIKASPFDTLVDPAEGKDEVKINTFETEETDIAIAMLNVFIKEMGEFYLPYVERTTKIMLTIVQSMINESVKQEALESLPLLVKLVRENNLDSGIAYTKNFLEVLTKACLEEYDTEILISELTAMKEIFELYGNTRFLTAEQLKAFSQQIIKILLKSDQRKDDTKGFSNDDDLEDEEKELLAEEITMEQEVQVAVSELIGQLFKTHKQMNAGLIDYITKNLLPKVFTDGLSENMYKFGIFLIDDMVDHLGYEILPGLWNDFYAVFLKFCLHRSVTVRHASCYGLGIYAQNTPPEIFKPLIQKSLQVLIQAADIPKGSESQKMYGHCKDNAISAFGKIIKYHGGSFDPKPCLLLWLNYLPLKNDKQEGHIQHSFLTEIVINNPTLLMQGETQQSALALLKILQVFGDILQTKCTTPQITQGIKKSIHKLKTFPLFVSNYDMLWSKLNEMQTAKLTMLAKQP